jgi:hypothetical protein
VGAGAEGELLKAISYPKPLILLGFCPFSVCHKGALSTTIILTSVAYFELDSARTTTILRREKHTPLPGWLCREPDVLSLAK